MRRGLLVVLAIAVIALALWSWHRATKPQRFTHDDAGSYAGMTHVPSLPTTTSGTPPPPPPLTDDAGRAAPPVEPQINPPDVQARMAEVHARLQDILRPCLATVATTPAPGAEFRFSYRLTFANNEGTVSEAKVVWSEVNSAALETCFMQKVAAAHWTQEEPDGTTTVEDAFRMSDLK